VSRMWNEFKGFAMKGNVLDLAIAVIIGGAFGKIVTSLVSDLIMPIIGLLLGGISFVGLQVQIGKAVIPYGVFLQNVVDFFIISFSIFLCVRMINRFKKKEEEKPTPEQIKSDEAVLLMEIRDLLKEKQQQ